MYTNKITDRLSNLKFIVKLKSIHPFPDNFSLLLGVVDNVSENYSKCYILVFNMVSKLTKNNITNNKGVVIGLIIAITLAMYSGIYLVSLNPYQDTVTDTQNTYINDGAEYIYTDEVDDYHAANYDGDYDSILPTDEDAPADTENYYYYDDPASMQANTEDFYIDDSGERYDNVELNPETLPDTEILEVGE
jgi:hypothetical protein